MHLSRMRLLVGAALLVALLGVTATLLAQRADAGAVDTVFVNSTANTDDGICNGPPNDASLGNCTLREAINDVNAGLADTIKFHAAIFPELTPGVIDLETVGGDLPPLTREVVIDNTGTGVVLDCDAQNDDTAGCTYGLAFFPSHNGWDFSLIGDGNFTIQQIDGDGILVDGDAACIPFIDPFCSLASVSITGIDIHEVEDDGIDIIDVADVIKLLITNSIITGDNEDSGENGIHYETEGADNYTFDNIINIMDNRIFGGDGIDINVLGSLYGLDLSPTGHHVDVNVVHNEMITGDAGTAVRLGYCRNAGDACDAHDSVIDFAVMDNGKLASNDDSNGTGDAVRIDVNATASACAPHVNCNENVTTNIDVTGNSIVDSDDDDGVRVQVDICCATSDSTANINVNDNLDIVGDDEAVDINATVGNGPDNTAVVNVNNNGELTGEGDDGVDIDVHAGHTGGDVDSDENTTTVSVSGNDDISGDDDDGVDIQASSGKEGGPGDADRNETTVDVNGNGNVDGDDDGVSIDARAGTTGGPGDADDNITTVSVSGNGDIDGADDEGVDISATSGHVQAGGPPNVTGDGNATEVLVDGNDGITGHNGHGIEVDSFAGGTDAAGERNSTQTVVTGNGDIEGQGGGGVILGGFDGDSGSDGIHLENSVCCDSANTNTILIDDNRDITGQDGDGIDIDEVCCSLNFITITDNSGTIKGNQDNGIELSPCLESGDPEDIQSVVEPDIECMGDTVTELIIDGNDISDSGHNGILVCCGAFQFPLTQAPPAISGLPFKSVISNNTISHNGTDGIDLDTTIGVNIEHNEISLNGLTASNGDNGVEIDWQFAWVIAQATGNLVKIPAHFNRISENSIHDNAGLGINLIGSDPDNGNAPGAGTENGTDADGVGCVNYPPTPIASNDCIPYPKFTYLGGAGNKVSGTSCSMCYVELFYADPTVGDQTGPLDRQHGEGVTFITTGQANAAGQFSIQLDCELAAGILTATATDKLKNTSEFSSNVDFPGTPDCPTPTPTATNTAVPTDTPVPGPTDTPAPTSTTPPTVEPAKDCGDVNDDGLVNAVDATLILQFQAQLITTLPNAASADVNNDGSISAVDASLILQKSAGLIPQSALDCG